LGLSYLAEMRLQLGSLQRLKVVGYSLEKRLEKNRHLQHSHNRKAV
jgi:hypothetical protein